MKTEIVGKPAFAHLHIELDPKESIVAEGGSMASMSSNLDMTAKPNGGWIRGLLRKFFANETLFVNVFQNNTEKKCQLTLTQSMPGDLYEIELNGESLYLQPGAYVASTSDIKLGLKWAGFASWFSKEGLFKMSVSGHGKVWFGAYGGLIEKNVEGEFIVDTSHIVAYPPGIKLKIRLAGGMFSSFFGGEGFVSRIEGKGRIFIQTRSVDNFISWINPKLY